jgi:predicted Zn-dependent protease
MRKNMPLSAGPVIFMVALAMLLPAFSFCPSKTFALSIEAEEKMGREAAMQIRRYFELVDDDFVNQYFNELGQFLTTPLETKHFPYRFYIIKDNTLNAFAIPGGHIFFFSGLIDVMDSADELASILCHEIGHVYARHMAKRMAKSKKIGLATMAGILAGVLIGGEAAGALMMGSMAAGVQAQLYYSRNDERQADQLGLKYMQAAGFDASGLVSTLKKIEKGNWMGSDQVPTYLLTHPTGPERMSTLESMLTNSPPGHPGERGLMFRRLFPLFQTIVRAKGLETDVAEGIFTRELEKDPDSASAHFGLGIVYTESSEYEQAIRHLNKAQKKEPEFVPILTTLGKTYQMNGEDRKAILVLKKAMKLAHDDKSITFLLGVSYENLEQYERAARLFERLAYLHPVKEEVYYHLGISYGRLDRLALAHYNFGIYFKRIGRMDKSVFHFQKALELAEDDFALKDKIRKETKEIPRKPSPEKSGG